MCGVTDDVSGQCCYLEGLGQRNGRLKRVSHSDLGVTQHREHGETSKTFSVFSGVNESPSVPSV